MVRLTIFLGLVVAGQAAEPGTGTIHVSADGPGAVYLRRDGEPGFRRVADHNPATVELELGATYTVRIVGRDGPFTLIRGEQPKVTSGQNLSIPTSREVDWGRISALASLGLAAMLAAVVAVRRRSGEEARRLAADLNRERLRAARAEARTGDPTRIGRYTVVGRLGTGGMAAVFRVEDEFGDVYALKMPGRASARFAREWEILSRMSHPGIVRLRDYSTGEAEGIPYLVMELVAGETLADRLARNTVVPPEEARAILRSLVEALDYAHRQGVVHRDLKPANLFLLPGGQVKLVDFGIARAADLATLTAAGEMFGTPAYMAPEQIQHGEGSPAADLYAVGVVAYEMMAGSRPWLDGDPLRILLEKQVGPPPPLRKANPAVDQPLSDLVGRLLDPDPAGRPATAAEVLEGL